MTEAGKALHGRDERPGEQALRGMLAVPGDVVVDDLVVVRGAGAPVEDLLAGQVLEDELLSSSTSATSGAGVVAAGRPHGRPQ
ncbi:hypothetical protein [Streptomyces griseoluteus]|uniref:hypothetical protein n=1 Tax=Streptomyces griseoluteus TaxID=29306 RepID=UPI0037013B4F